MKRLLVLGAGTAGTMVVNKLGLLTLPWDEEGRLHGRTPWSAYVSGC